mmetsp:Transcript_34871/g.87732  ORF Transcript_34871/g.87732 Transcript_34871/m.87732 type:complete len:1020 (+) Transcript_34871:1453-4512(+)|eukprot:CAMPEP_0177637666 /NCGR_PEP_ID=MMETSP0447-20121125/5088_1 /TAXON_ID=0 /ORGANISM="Stygamoeba regulata, Strain BSH-02190019" /LENGTH=1019 /DNA_ID=CAMNT_0019139599 /DNA_START=49 /DNA_END=3108 /DNA_ORIENTATION=+
MAALAFSRLSKRGLAVGRLACPLTSFPTLVARTAHPPARMHGSAPPPSRESDLHTPLDQFPPRHIGPRSKQRQEMLDAVGYKTMEEFITALLPANTQLPRPLNLKYGDNVGERRALQILSEMAKKNKVFKSYIGLGYYNTITPGVILRNVVENPAWYTAYTPYQAEISQGRLEMLLNYQTMVTDLTGMRMANASLLDEATAAAETHSMCLNLATNRSSEFFIDQNCSPQTIAVVLSRAEPFPQHKVHVGDPDTFDFPNSKLCGALFAYPGRDGQVRDFTKHIKDVHENGGLSACVTDLLACVLLRAPGEFGFDIVLGNSQRFGVPMGFGGPHAAFLAVADEKFTRRMPGRIIGISKDSSGKPALRMALQTREQHIRREKATSNICTAQALLANVAASYAIYHGPQGLTRIARRVHALTCALAARLKASGLKVHDGREEIFFDTLKVDVGSDASVEKVKQLALQNEVNLRHLEGTTQFCVSLDETTSLDDVQVLHAILTSTADRHSLHAPAQFQESVIAGTPFARSSRFLMSRVFNIHQSETEMMRYLYLLQTRDLSLTTAMIPLGSCTMKLNATSEMVPITWPEFSNIHPFVPADQVQGYHQMIQELGDYLCEITGLPNITFQPNSGAQGEYTGLRLFREYFHRNNMAHRNICLIPVSAHGTNPASAAMCGMDIKLIKCKDEGSLDMDHLRGLVEDHGASLCCLMITYPSTYGVYEENILEITALIHAAGGLVYMDGANLNAQVGLCRPGDMGADVVHMNLHKTFCIPHGGGGPGMGPICFTDKLAPYAPQHPEVEGGPCNGSRETGILPVSAAPWGSPMILPISWMYITMMGPTGLREATEWAVLNANYMKSRLESHYPIRFSSAKDLVAHEFIIDLRPYQKAGVTAQDVAKRMLDFNFHAPTMSFPVASTLMVEPTESESKEEMDRMVEALILIRKEIAMVEQGKIDKSNNPLKNAPHTVESVVSAEWYRPYTREEAAFPTLYVRHNKFWPSVARVDDVYGDRHLICACPPTDEWED